MNETVLLITGIIFFGMWILTNQRKKWKLHTKW